MDVCDAMRCEWVCLFGGAESQSLTRFPDDTVSYYRSKNTRATHVPNTSTYLVCLLVDFTLLAQFA